MRWVIFRLKRVAYSISFADKYCKLIRELQLQQVSQASLIYWGIDSTNLLQPSVDLYKATLQLAFMFLGIIQVLFKALLISLVFFHLAQDSIFLDILYGKQTSVKVDESAANIQHTARSTCHGDPSGPNLILFASAASSIEASSPFTMVSCRLVGRVAASSLSSGRFRSSILRDPSDGFDDIVWRLMSSRWTQSPQSGCHPNFLESDHPLCRLL